MQLSVATVAVTVVGSTRSAEGRGSHALYPSSRVRRDSWGTISNYIGRTREKWAGKEKQYAVHWVSVGVMKSNAMGNLFLIMV